MRGDHSMFDCMLFLYSRYFVNMAIKITGDCRQIGPYLHRGVGELQGVSTVLFKESLSRH